MKSKEDMTEEKKLKKGKKNKNEKASLQNNNCVNDRILTVLCQEKESCVQADEKAVKKKKKDKHVNECLFNTTNGEDISKKTKKKKKNSDCKMEAPLCKITDNKKRKKSTCADLEHVEIDEKEELPKKIKKKKNAEAVEWTKEKNTADERACDAIKEKHSKKHKKSPQIVAENQETTEETGDSEGVKKSKMALKPVKNKKVKTREHGDKVTVADIKDNVKKKKEKPAKSDHMKEEKKKAKKTLECADVEEPQLRQKKKSKKHSIQDEAEPPLVNYEEQQSEEKLTGTGRKKKKRKERTTMVDAPAEHLCSGDAPKPKKTKVKKEAEDQNVSGQSKQHRIHFQAFNLVFHKFWMNICFRSRPRWMWCVCL